MASLERTQTGGFSISEAHTIEELEHMDVQARLGLLIPTEALFRSYPALSLPGFYEKLCRSGCEIYLAKLKIDLPIGTRVRICDATGIFFALGEVREYENGRAVNAIKTFSLE